MSAELSPEVSRLLEVVRTLPSPLVREVSHYAAFLGARLTEETDAKAVTIESLRRFNAEHSEEDWGEDLLNPLER
jgi:hypothetical protein